MFHRHCCWEKQLLRNNGVFRVMKTISKSLLSNTMNHVENVHAAWIFRSSSLADFDVTSRKTRGRCSDSCNFLGILLVLLSIGNTDIQHKGRDSGHHIPSKTAVLWEALTLSERGRVGRKGLSTKIITAVTTATSAEKSQIDWRVFPTDERILCFGDSLPCCRGVGSQQWDFLCVDYWLFIVPVSVRVYLVLKLQSLGRLIYFVGKVVEINIKDPKLFLLRVKQFKLTVITE